MGRVIAIDGPSGAGKSTISRLIAEKLGFQFLDTGALYRAVALHLSRKGLHENSTDVEIADALTGVEISFIDGKVFLKDASCMMHNASRDFGEDVSEEIRTTDIGHYASVFSAKIVVRKFLLQMQRDTAISNDIVAEGRDMTTVVFPSAWKKFFITASKDGRAKRRYLQLKEKGIEITMEEALKDVIERDKRDSSRDIAPLKLADDAVYIDTTDLGIEEVLNRILEEIKN